MLSTLEEEFGPSPTTTTVSSEDQAWDDNFEEELRQETEASRDRHQRALENGRLMGHEPVLLMPAMDFLFPPQAAAKGAQPAQDGEPEFFDGLYLDATFGRGGYTREVLSHLSDEGRLVSFDMDPSCLPNANALEEEDARFRFVNRNFGTMADAITKEPLSSLVKEFGAPQGIVFDIGISSPQLDDRTRGFSLQSLGQAMDFPMDLRMNPSVGMSASDWLAQASAEELAWVILNYGNDHEEELEAERMAQIIMDDQTRNGPFRSIRRFAELVGRAKTAPGEEFEHPVMGFEHPARLTVQAIRLFLNSELEEMKRGLKAAFAVLAMGGRVVVSVFKRKEERVVKQFCAEMEDPDPDTVKRLRTKRRLVELYPLAGTDLEYSVKLLQGSLKPAMGEVAQNRRSRSGIMFALEKVPRTCPRAKVKPRQQSKRFVEPARMPLCKNDEEN